MPRRMVVGLEKNGDRFGGYLVEHFERSDGSIYVCLETDISRHEDGSPKKYDTTRTFVRHLEARQMREVSSELEMLFAEP